MIRTTAALLVAMSLAAGLRGYRRQGMSGALEQVGRLTGGLGLFVLVGIAVPDQSIGEALVGAVARVAILVTVQCLIDVLTERLRPATRFALQAAAAACVLAAMVSADWADMSVFQRPLLVAIAIAVAVVSLAPVAADYMPGAWANVRRRLPYLADLLAANGTTGDR